MANLDFLWLLFVFLKNLVKITLVFLSTLKIQNFAIKPNYNLSEQKIDYTITWSKQIYLFFEVDSRSYKFIFFT